MSSTQWRTTHPVRGKKQRTSVVTCAIGRRVYRTSRCELGGKKITKECNGQTTMKPVCPGQRRKCLHSLSHAVGVADLKMEVLGMSHRALVTRAARRKIARFGSPVFHAVDRHTHQLPTAIAELNADTCGTYQEQQNEYDGT